MGVYVLDDSRRCRRYSTEYFLLYCIILYYTVLYCTVLYLLDYSIVLNDNMIRYVSGSIIICVCVYLSLWGPNPAARSPIMKPSRTGRAPARPPSEPKRNNIPYSFSLTTQQTHVMHIMRPTHHQTRTKKAWL
jgi:hypothetical protein